jgi:hypothetical protein
MVVRFAARPAALRKVGEQMTLSDELHSNRIRKLHEGMLEAADRYPSIYNVMVRSKDARLIVSSDVIYAAIVGGLVFFAVKRGLINKIKFRGFEAEIAKPGDQLLESTRVPK